MNEPITQLDTRHGVPRGGVTPWEETRRVLETAELFWLSTVRADGRTHVTPCVPVWHDGAIHFTAEETAQKTVNLRGNAHVILTTGCNQTEGLTVVVEGDAVRITDQDALLPRSHGVGDQVGWKLALPGTQRLFLTSTMKTNNAFSQRRTSCSLSNPPRSSPLP